MRQDKFLLEMGQRLALRRRSLKMTQESLAERVGVSTQMISNMELGKKAVRPENLYHICRALGLSSDYVFSGVVEETGEQTPDTETSRAWISSNLDRMTPEEIRLMKDFMEYMILKKEDR